MELQLLDVLARRWIGHGDLVLIGPSGARRRYGDGVGPPVVVRLTRRAVRRLLVAAPLALGEGYMSGDVEVVEGDIYALLELVGRNFAERVRPIGAGRARLPRLGRSSNGLRASRRHVAHHYDLSDALYRRFLDPDMHYSCAYFSAPGDTLEAAQAAKVKRIVAKLALRPGGRVLDIGSGWGAMALSLARAGDVSVQGITLSARQLEFARDRAAAEGFAARVRFDLQDYRHTDGRFDRIVSIGMLEHVGRADLQTYFAAVARLLHDDGAALIHFIGRRHGPGRTNPWMAKYIFPGGYAPALSEVAAAAERAGLWITDVEVLRLHYAATLRLWRSRFCAQRGQLAAEYDERFVRMFEFYLALSEVSFRHGGFAVFQIQLAKRVDALPITRDYMTPDSMTPDSMTSGACAA